ncbi:unnamed protein product [Urochloa decumbens]|uniref:Uncharacterized protein n=1 Tax=Urochloa decumbens TaxID=240449 RepID=A0ABC8VST9_9POAL
MGSWVRTITTPFRKILNPQKDGKKTPRHHHHQQQSPSAMEGHSGEMERSQLYGEVMACTYEDVQVMWSMLDKARICSAAAS